MCSQFEKRFFFSGGGRVRSALPIPVPGDPLTVCVFAEQQNGLTGSLSTELGNIGLIRLVQCKLTAVVRQRLKGVTQTA